MKYLLLAACAAVSASCSEVIDLPRLDGSGLGTVDETFGYVRNVSEPRPVTTLELRNGEAGWTEVYFGLTRPAAKTMSVTFAYDAAALDAYNLAHATTYEGYPAEAVSLRADGRVLLEGGSQRSAPVRVTVAPAAGTVEGRTYAVPLRATPSDPSVKIGTDGDTYMLLVKNMGSVPDASKASGIKIISCMEVNNTNPLNNLEFTLRNSGKMLVDIVVLFASNMNYDAAAGRVYISNNENIRHLLENREKYIVPLQQHGMKVVLGMLGNHDQAGVAGLADETARAFAREVKNLCEAYDLDGVFWDDEYSKYAPGPGFSYPASSAAAARLIYETKRAMPDKLNIVYMNYRLVDENKPYGDVCQGLLYTLPDVDGVQAGAYVDYALNDYRHNDFPAYNGLRWSQLSLYSEEYAKGLLASDENYREIRDKGCGVHMIFALDPARENFLEPDKFGDYQMQSLRNIADHLFGDPLVWSGKIHAKDW